MLADFDNAADLSVIAKGLTDESLQDRTVRLSVLLSHDHYNDTKPLFRERRISLLEQFPEGFL